MFYHRLSDSSSFLHYIYRRTPLSSVSSFKLFHTNSQRTTFDFFTDSSLRSTACFNSNMGSFTSTSCFKDSNTAKVIDSQGNLRKVKLTAKAAELMLDEPGHVIAPMEDLKRTRRVVAMRADDELLAGKVYVLVPMQRVHCKVTDADMAIIESACAGKKRRKSGGARVLPDMGEEETQVDRVLPVHVFRLENYRPWTPVLEPISEVI